MLSSMYSGISGLNASNQRMAVVGDNIANVNTTAYKCSQLSFESLINQSVGGYTGQEIGGGVLLGDLSYDWNQGTIQRTSNPYDMAIAGAGFFMVKDADGKAFYTRDGEFTFKYDDATKMLQLKTASGMSVQGCVYAKPPVNPPAIVPIEIDSAAYEDITVDENGVYWGVTKVTPPAVGVKTALFQAVLCDTTDRSAMAKTNNNLYVKTTDDTSDPLTLGTPSMNGLGGVEASSLEMSNVDIAKEFVNMITAQRAFSANSKVITTSDEILQELVNIKR
jgi:flagellar hook protein FlgE